MANANSNIPKTLESGTHDCNSVTIYWPERVKTAFRRAAKEFSALDPLFHLLGQCEDALFESWGMAKYNLVADDRIVYWVYIAETLDLAL